MSDYKETIIEAGSKKTYFCDLWHSRELLYFLAWRDLLVRYKQTVIGIAWSILRPILTMVIFTIVFGRLAKLPSDGVPYELLVFTAMLPWQFFAGALQDCSGCLVANAALLSKVYFPRLILPASSIAVCLIDFFISLIVLFFLLGWYGVPPGWPLFLLPLFLFQAMLTAFGAGLWLAALNVKYRDVGHILPFLVQTGLFISPVGFSSSIVPDGWRVVYALNPLVGIIDGFRWAILGGKTPAPGIHSLLSILVTITLLLVGYRQFRLTERTFVDVI